jgi:hypothetical protein
MIIKINDRLPYTARSTVITEILKGLDEIIGRYWHPALVREMPYTYISELSEMIAKKLNEECQRKQDADEVK